MKTSIKILCSILSVAIISLVLLASGSLFAQDEPLELTLQLAHSSEVSSVTFSPNGQYVLSGSGDKTLKLWEVASGRLIRTFEGHSRAVNSVAFSPDGRYALSGSDDKTLKLWDVSSGRKIRTFKGQPAGNHQVRWDASSAASGVYLYRLQAGDFTETKKMLLMK